MTIPSSWLDPVKVERIIWHWTAGSYTASSLDREHYHILIEGDGKLIKGKHPIKSVVPPLYADQYAAHTSKVNSWSLGCAVCCMAGATENPFHGGKYPFTITQYEEMVEVTAQLCIFYRIPVTKNTVLTHAEVQTNLGKKQAGKWDITVFPEAQLAQLTGLRKVTAAEFGEAFRTAVEDEIEELSAISDVFAQVTAAVYPKNPSAWIRTPNGSVFLVEEGWTWEEVR